jgi:hypothetical protein
MANQPGKAQHKPRHCVYSGLALKGPPSERIRPKKFARYDDPVIPRSYWYVTAALTLGLLLGRFLPG